MDLDTLLMRYFGTADPGAVGAETLASGIERCQVDLGLEQDRGKRFALWAMLYLLGSAPDLDVAFENEEGKTYYHNSTTGATQWTKPEELGGEPAQEPQKSKGGEDQGKADGQTESKSGAAGSAGASADGGKNCARKSVSGFAARAERVIFE